MRHIIMESGLLHFELEHVNTEASLGKILFGDWKEIEGCSAKFVGVCV